MTTINRFRIRALCNALAVALGLGLAYQPAGAGQPGREWARQPGTLAGESAFDAATDKQGNVYIAGYTRGSLAGTNLGEGDAWIKKYSAAGALLWKRQLGTTADDAAWGATTDSAGNIYVAGTTSGSLGGTNHGTFDPWLARYSASGVLLWKRQPGTAEEDLASGVATDPQGNVYLAGGTHGSLAGPQRGDGDAWISKYSATGILLWKRQLGTSASDVAEGVATDRQGNVYIAGATNGSLGGPYQGQGDGWIAKYSATGVLLWKRQIGTQAGDVARNIATDKHRNVYVCGWTFGARNGYAWIKKYSAAGALLWHRQTDLLAFDTAHDVTTDENADAYVVGYTGDALSDAWIRKYSAAGILLWKRQIGTPTLDAGYGVATDDKGGVYIVGQTEGSIGGRYQGETDAFIVKFSQRP